MCVDYVHKVDHHNLQFCISVHHYHLEDSIAMIGNPNVFTSSVTSLMIEVIHVQALLVL